jgi:hypothetical protein
MRVRTTDATFATAIAPIKVGTNGKERRSGFALPQDFNGRVFGPTSMEPMAGSPFEDHPIEGGEWASRADREVRYRTLQRGWQPAPDGSLEHLTATGFPLLGSIQSSTSSAAHRLVPKTGSACPHEAPASGGHSWGVQSREPTLAAQLLG